MPAAAPIPDEQLFAVEIDVELVHERLDDGAPSRIVGIRVDVRDCIGNRVGHGARFTLDELQAFRGNLYLYWLTRLLEELAEALF